MTITVRQAVPGDEPTLAQLNGMVHALHVSARPDFFWDASAADLSDWFGGVLRNTRQRVWLAEVGKIPAGYLLAEIHERPATLPCKPRRWCEIDQVGVTEEMRGRGLARLLVDAAIDWARQSGIRRITAQCWSFNAEAQRAFARLGFTPMTVRLERLIPE